MYRYIYKITCTNGSFNGKFYFGQHTTENLDDDYKGSGRKIKDYLKKYPNDYIKEIISFHNTQEELNQAEYDIILPWLNNPMCLNLREGGGNYKLSEETKEKISKTWGKNIKKWSESRKGENNPMYGKKMSEETKKKLSEVHKGQVPWNKGLTGRIWVNNGIHNKLIFPEQLSEYLINGFIRGKIFIKKRDK